MSDPTMKAGPHQTIARVEHPKRGPGDAVHRNGPSFFQPDGGAPIPMPIDLGGAAVGRGSWLVLQDPEHGRIEAKVTESGTDHWRMWHPAHGAAWLVWGKSIPSGTGGSYFQITVEPDEGRSFPMVVGSLTAGTPTLAARRLKSRGKFPEGTDEENLWTTFGLRGGEVIAFRKDGPPPETEGAPAPARALQSDLFATGAV